MGTVVVSAGKDIDMAVYSFEGKTSYDDIRLEIDNYYIGKLNKYKICDFTRAELNVTNKEVIALADQVREKGKARKNGFDAIVVPNLLYYGLARMYIAYAAYTHRDPDALKLMVFRSFDEALEAIRRMAKK